MNAARLPTPTTLLATAIAMALLATPAAAQDTAQATSADTSTQVAQPQDATQAPAAQQDLTPEQIDAKELDAVKVVGLRASLQTAQSIKRDSVQIIDSVVAEDLGKLPDVTA